MDQEIKQKWIDALRSGKYKQGRGRLKNDKDEYCCLGVLCAVTKSKGWVGYSLLPERVAKRVGISIYGELPYIVRNSSTLTSLNDSGISFSEIADIIEKQL